MHTGKPCSYPTRITSSAQFFVNVYLSANASVRSVRSLVFTVTMPRQDEVDIRVAVFYDRVVEIVTTTFDIMILECVNTCGCLFIITSPLQEYADSSRFEQSIIKEASA